MRPRSALIKGTLAASAFLLALVICEFAFRWVSDLYWNGSYVSRLNIVPHPSMGWSLNSQRAETSALNSCGESVVTKPPPSPYLIRIPPEGGKMRLLFLGDSFTQAHEVSTGKAYYDVFAEAVGDRFRVYAAGVGGFSSLQEYLLLSNVYEQVRPDLLLWQLTSNDPIENVYYGKDLADIQLPRPYLSAEPFEVEIRDPGYWILENSRVANFLFQRLMGFDASHHLGLADWLMRYFRPDPELIRRNHTKGLLIIGALLDRMKLNFPSTRIVGFSVSESSDAEFASIFRSHGVEYLADFQPRLREHWVHFDCSPLDTHWNHAGNAAAGKILADLLLRGNLAEPEPESLPSRPK